MVITQKNFKVDAEYIAFLEQLKIKIKSAQIKAACAVNKELIIVYWEIGKGIAEKEKNEGWGSKVIDTLVSDLKEEFPHIKGFSRRNLFYMRRFAKAYEDFGVMQQVAAQIPWGHTMLLLDKIENTEERLWYTKKTLENGWSRNMLLLRIESDLYNREGKAITNFERTLPQPQSDLANQLLKTLTALIS